MENKNRSEQLFSRSKLLFILLFVAAFSTLPWIGFGDFYTKGEPREAGLAVYMINNMSWEAWILPQSYATEFAYKPPLTHWLIASFSIIFNKGEVTPFLSRLPSALAFVAMVGVCFVFFAKRKSAIESFIAGLILITCFEIHRAAMTARIDMLFTFLLVAGLIQIYIWLEQKKKINIFGAWIFLTLASLAKGPAGIVLPCGILGIYLLLQHENFFKALFKCSLFMISSSLILTIWYYLAYKVQGDSFLIKAFGENVGRFLSMNSKELGLDYELGVNNPCYYYPLTLLSGLLPSTILLVVSLFFLKYKKPQSITHCIKDFSNRFKEIDKVSLFSFSIIVVSLVFFTIPSSKRSVYIMLIYPFLSIFTARFFLYLTKRRSLSVRIYTWILIVLISISLICLSLLTLNILNPKILFKRERTLYDIQAIIDQLQQPTFLIICASLLLILSIIGTLYILRKRRNTVSILVSGFSLIFFLNLFLDSSILPAFKNSYSSKPFAEFISDKYNLKDNTYVITDLRNGYFNMYGLNFYLGNYFKDFRSCQSEECFLLISSNKDEEVKDLYQDKYDFSLLEKCSKYTDFKNEIFLYALKKKAIIGY